MFGRGADGFEGPRAVFIDGADGSENLVEDVVGERCSTEDKDELESKERRGCG